MKRISIFGATGSIGQSTLDLIGRRMDDFQVVVMTGGANIAQLAGDALKFRPELVVTAYPEKLADLRAALDGTGIECAAGQDALVEAATRPAEWIMSAIVGVAGRLRGSRH